MIGINILFTTSETPGSQLIRAVTKEPVSHCAIQVGNYVMSAEPAGVGVMPYSLFRAHHKIKFIVPAITEQSNLDKNFGKPYDYLGLLYLGFRYLLPSVFPKKNLWQMSGMFMCTETITDLLFEKPDDMITPYQLYLKLTMQER